MNQTLDHPLCEILKIPVWHSTSTMASKEHMIHRLDLRRIVVEGDLQHIGRVATLCLKDEDPDKRIMQVHVDGNTLVSPKIPDVKALS